MSWSQEQTIRDPSVVVNDLKDFDLKISLEKSCQEPAPCMDYLGLYIDPIPNCVTFRAEDHQHPSHIVSPSFSWEKLCSSNSLHPCTLHWPLHLQPLMMRDCQLWVTSLHLLLSQCNNNTPLSITVLHLQRNPAALIAQIPLRVMLPRVALVTDVSLTGLDGPMMGRQWMAQMC